MTDPASVEAIYTSVIEDTIFKLSPEFENAGVPMVVLSRLQELWTKRMELTVRHPAPPVSMVPPVPKAAVSVNQAQLQSAQLAKKEEEGNGSSAHGVQNGSQNASLPAGSNDASVAPHDPLRYTITEPTPGVKAELTDAALGAGEETQGDAAVAAAEPVKPTIDATLAVEKKDSDSDSSDVSDDDDVDTSTWTNSIMSLYEDPIKRNKDKRTYKLQKGILHINGQDYLFKSGKAEFAWV